MLPNTTLSQHRATGVEYRELIPGSFAFDCRQLRATISAATCAKNWQRAEPGSSCIGCQIGAQHAGKRATPQIVGRLPCVRCGRKDQRMIGGVLCVNCYNRQREAMLGRNAKGQFPHTIGANLHESFSVLRIPNAEAAIQQIYKRRVISPDHLRVGLRSDFLPGLPRFEAVEHDAAWLEVIVSGREELARIVERLMPAAMIEEVEVSESLTDRHRRRSTLHLVQPCG
jgi:hypothetical protein